MQWLTTKQAAEKLGVSDVRVRAMIKAGRLPAQKFGHVHMISEDDLKLVENRKVGRPPKIKAEIGSKAGKKKGGKK
jgi:excisionase family DNA binding protein